MATIELEVREVRSETSTIRSIRLDLAGRAFPFKPGQYCLVQLPGLPEGDDRPLSMAGAPSRHETLVFATRESQSAYKKAFFRLKAGDRVTVTGPTGRFVYDGALPSTVFLSGGIGITPIKSMIEYAVDRQLNNRMVLLFGNRLPADIPFRRELDDLGRAAPNLKVVHVVSDPGPSGWTGEIGRIDEALIKRKVGDPQGAHYYICGPPGMVAGLRETLARIAIPKEQVHIENFEGYE